MKNTVIYTSYFDNIENLPITLCPISIAGREPENWVFPCKAKFLAPKWSFFKTYRETGDKDYYTKHFQEEVLDKLNAGEVYIALKLMAGDRKPCLMCYEKPEEFCHRHLVANWLEEKLHIKVKEYENTMKTLNFFKQDNKWYADVPNHTLEDNEMVFGSDIMLDIFAGGKENVTLTLSDKPEDEYGKPMIILTRKEHDDDGAFYGVEVLTTLFTGSLSDIWICNVTHDVFGEHPEEIYIYNIE